jgi:hypothetical protein
MTNFISSEHRQRSSLYDSFVSGAMELAQINDHYKVLNYPMSLVVGNFYLPRISHGLVYHEKSNIRTPAIPWLEGERELRFNGEGLLNGFLLDRHNDPAITEGRAVYVGGHAHSVVSFNPKHPTNINVDDGQVAFHEGIHVAQNLANAPRGERSTNREIEAYVGQAHAAMVRGNRLLPHVDLIFRSVMELMRDKNRETGTSIRLSDMLHSDPDRIRREFGAILSGRLTADDPVINRYLRDGSTVMRARDAINVA